MNLNWRGSLLLFAVSLVVVGHRAHANLTTAAIMLAAHSRADLRRVVYSEYEPRVRHYSNLFGIDPERFLSLYPVNQVYERILWELTRSGQLTTQQIVAGERIDPEALILPVDTAVVTLIKTYQGLKDAGSDTAPEFAPLPSHELGGDRHRDFSEWSYSDLIAFIDRVAAPAAEDIANAMHLPPELFERANARVSIHDRVFLDLWDRLNQDPIRFLPGGRFGAAYRSWVRSEVFTMIVEESSRAVSTETPQVIAPVDPTRENTYEALVSRGYAALPHVPGLPSEFWDRVLREVELRMAKLVGSSRLQASGTLAFTEPGFTLADLRRELLLDSLRIASQGRVLGDPLVATVSRQTALHFLSRKQLYHPPIGHTETIETGKGTTTAQSIEVEEVLSLWEHKEGSADLRDRFLKVLEAGGMSDIGEGDEAAREAQAAFAFVSGLIHNSLFLFKKLPRQTGYEIFAYVQQRIGAMAPRHKLPSTDELLATVILNLDVDLAVYTARKLNEVVDLDELKRQTVLSIKTTLARVKARNSLRRTLRAPKVSHPSFQFWNRVVRRIPISVKFLCARYFISTEDFWMKFTESDALEMVGEAADQWRGYEADGVLSSTNAIRIADRGIRLLLEKYVREEKLELPADWERRLKLEETDGYALMVFFPSALINDVEGFWQELPEEEEVHKNFKRIYIEGLHPAWVLPENKRGSVRVYAGFDRFLELREIFVRCPLLASKVPHAELAKLISKVIPSLAQEISALVLGRVRNIPLSSIAQNLESRLSRQRFSGSLEHLGTGDWERLARESVREIVSGMLKENGEYVSLSYPGINPKDKSPIPVGYALPPLQSGFSEQLWKTMVVKIQRMVRIECKKFSVPEDAFWQPRGPFEFQDVVAAVLSEAAAWKQAGYGPIDGIEKGTELVQRAVRGVVLKLFHERKGEVPADWREKIKSKSLTRADVLAMIPAEDFKQVLAVWAFGEKKSHIENEITQDFDRDSVFRDWFVKRVPWEFAEQKYQIENEDAFRTRVGALFDSFMAIWEILQDPVSRSVFVVPPQSYQGGYAFWLTIQEHIKSYVTEFLDEDALQRFWADLRRPSAGDVLSNMILEEHERQIVVVSRSHALMQRQAKEIASRVAARLIPGIVGLVPTPTRHRSQSIIETEKLPEVVVASEMRAEEADIVQLNTPSPAPEILIEDVHEEAVLHEPELLVRPLISRSPVKGVEKTPPAKEGWTIPSTFAPMLNEKMREAVEQLAKRYFLQSNDFFAADGGFFSEEDVGRNLALECKAWMDNKYGELEDEEEANAIANRVARKMLARLFREQDKKFPEDWKTQLKGVTDMEALFDMLPLNERNMALRSWRSSGVPKSYIEVIENRFMVKLPSKMNCSAALAESKTRQLQHLQEAVAFNSFMKFWETQH